MLLNKRGAALLQVLIVTAILAGMSAMILRLSLSRTITSRQTRHVVNVQTAIESCMAQVNAIWAAKTPEAYARDLSACQMCEPDNTSCRTDSVNITFEGQVFQGAPAVHDCGEIEVVDGTTKHIYALMSENHDIGIPSPCKITYVVEDGKNL